MTFTWQIVLLLLCCHLLGTVPSGLIVSRLKGVDIRKHGSGNLGATNVGRVLGKKWGALVLALDAGKGAAASLATSAFVARAASPWLAADPAHGDWLLLGAGLCCLLGNVAPFYLGFRGGKGVAASLGLVLGIYPYLTLPGAIAGLVWVLTVKLSGYVSLGSILAACALPLAFVGVARGSSWSLGDHYPLFCLSLLMTAFVLVRHRSNIGRLLAGTENRIGKPQSRSSPFSDGHGSAGNSRLPQPVSHQQTIRPARRILGRWRR
jgi:glycerol-3-phosphate acyltransferase PlsY